MSGVPFAAILDNRLMDYVPLHPSSDGSRDGGWPGSIRIAHTDISQPARRLDTVQPLYVRSSVLMRRNALLTSSRREGFGISGALGGSSARSFCGEADMKTEATPFRWRTLATSNVTPFATLSVKKAKSMASSRGGW
jgi:hypothetical protein